MNCVYGEPFAGCSEVPDEWDLKCNSYVGEQRASSAVPSASTGVASFGCEQLAGWWAYDCGCTCLPITKYRGRADVGYGWLSLHQALEDYRHQVRCALYPDPSCDNVPPDEEASWSESYSSSNGNWQILHPQKLLPEQYNFNRRLSILTSESLILSSES